MRIPENHTNFISLDGSVVSSNLLIGMLNSSLLEYIFRRLNSNTQVSSGRGQQVAVTATARPRTQGEH